MNHNETSKSEVSSLFYSQMKSHLSRTETIIKYFKKSRLAYLTPYILGIAVLLISCIEIILGSISKALGIGGTTAVLISYPLFLLSIILLSTYEIKILHTRYAITNHRVIMIEGILHEDFKSTTYKYIADTELHQNLIDKILGTGTVGVTTTGNERENINLEKIRHPRDIKSIMQDKVASAHEKKQKSKKAQ